MSSHPLPSPHPFNAQLRAAAYDGNLAELRALLSAGANPLLCGPSGKCSLHLAAMGGGALALRILAANLQPRSLNLQDHHGQTALHLAARKNHGSCVSALLELGADPLRRDAFGRQPFELCDEAECSQAFERHLQTEMDLGAAPFGAASF